MTARLLTTLALVLPLAACAAQPGPGQAPSAPSTVAQDKAAAPVQPPATTVPATTTPATQADLPRQDTPAAAPAQRSDAKAAPRHAEAGGQRAGNGAASPATTPAASGAATRDTAAATAPSDAGAGTTPATSSTAATPATPATPDVAAPRPAAPAATVPPVTMPSGSSTGSLLQTLFALIVVLAVLGALAWFLKRYGPKVAGGNANLRVVGSLSLGGRERIVVVEVGNEWIVVGASPGRINALATMPRQDGQNNESGGAHAALAPHAPAAHSFADWLKQTIDKRK
jgi:flagellar biosynthetic protein FliO